MRKRKNRPFSVKLQSAFEGGGRGNARKDLREMNCSQMRRFKVETADLRLLRRLPFARWSGRETAPTVEVASSRFSVEVTDLYKQRLGDGERRGEAVFYREKTVSRV